MRLTSNNFHQRGIFRRLAPKRFKLNLVLKPNPHLEVYDFSTLFPLVAVERATEVQESKGPYVVKYFTNLFLREVSNISGIIPRYLHDVMWNLILPRNSLEQHLWGNENGFQLVTPAIKPHNCGKSDSDELRTKAQMDLDHQLV